MHSRLFTVCKALLVFIVMFVFGLSSVRAQNFLYTNNNEDGPSTVTAYSVNVATGALTEITGSPYSTGGSGIGGGFYAGNSSTVRAMGTHFCVGNAGSDDISVFTINTTTGALTPAAGSPFATGGTSGFLSHALASTPQFLYATNPGSSTISGFSMDPITGVLTPLTGSPYSSGLIDGIMATPDGRFLIAADASANVIHVYSINSITGVLTSVAGSPFSNSGGFSGGIAINNFSSLLFVGSGTSIAVYTIGGSGTLTEIAGSPFATTNTQAVRLSPDNTLLFAPEIGSNTTRVFSVASGGSLTEISGSPFAGIDDNPGVPDVQRDGDLLYVPNADDGSVTVYTIAADGTLAAVTGSPFLTGQGAGMLALSAYPSGFSDQRLPVELSGFSLSSSTGKITLAWQTASEIDNAGFEVQRASGKEGSFSTIASYLIDSQLAGLGTSATGKAYTCVDNQIEPGSYRYRLVDVSGDGIRREHPAKLIRVESDEEFAAEGSMRLHAVMPNPVRDEVQVSFALPEETLVTIEVYTAEGRLVNTPVVRQKYGASNHAESVSMSGFPAGAYIVRLTAGRQMRVQRFVVVH